MDGGDDLYRLLADRFRSLEANQEELKEQLNVLFEEKNNVKSTRNGGETSGSGEERSYHGWSRVPGVFFSGSPFRKVLEHIGHAVHASRAHTGEITFWNRSAEKLYGYLEYEAVGQKDVEFLVDEEHRASAEGIMERLNSGHSWSGQFPLKKRSGRIFMALVTKSPLYEDGELVGIITVSSDAAVFNNIFSEKVRIYQDTADSHFRLKGLNMNKIQWPQQPQIAASVSNMASKVLFRRRDNHTSDSCTSDPKEATEHDNQNFRSERPPRSPAVRLSFNAPTGRTKTEVSPEKDESTFEFPQPSTIAAKILSKLHIGGLGNLSGDTTGSMQHSGGGDMSVNKEVFRHSCSHRDSQETDSCRCINHSENNHSQAMKNSHFASEYQRLRVKFHMPSGESEYRECSACAEVARSRDQFSMSYLSNNAKESKANAQQLKPSETQNDLQEQSPKSQGPQQLPNLVESTGSSRGSSSSKGDNESNLIVDCEILWEDLHLREEIGQGSCGIVYRGIWNGSDVAVKVYYGNDCTDYKILDYEKEIEIMRRLRHPNVLLFMGAVCSQEKVAVVTEYLSRGSLFKALHKNNQPLDVKRRLRMALDVARGMNYLHCRNPPIVHRDLKSSNLLVDKSWTVKVGDFGLSRLKCATFLSTKTGRGTPQWMAPEVLRNEPSTEKSDIFSFGVVLWELMTESVPWSNLNSVQVVGVVGFMDRRLEIPEKLDPRVSSIICDCWHRNSECRPSFKEIIERMTDIIQTGTGVVG